MSASGVNSGWRREYFIRAGICPCDQTRGDSCPRCDSGDYTSDQAAIRAAVAAVTERERQRALREARPAS